MVGMMAMLTGAPFGASPGYDYFLVVSAEVLLTTVRLAQ
jgi:hypothetical protein